MSSISADKIPPSMVRTITLRIDEYIPKDWEALERFQDAILKDKKVQSICINHQSWIEYNFNASTWAGLAKEIHKAELRIIKIYNKYNQ